MHWFCILTPATHHTSPFLPYPRPLTNNSPCSHNPWYKWDPTTLRPSPPWSCRQQQPAAPRPCYPRWCHPSHRFSDLYEHYPSYHKRGIPMYVMITWLSSHRTSKRPILDPADRSASPFPPRRPLRRSRASWANPHRTQGTISLPFWDPTKSYCQDKARRS